MKGIMKLWEVQDYHDCWILYRCILDRLFHLSYLAQNDSFDDFEKWSFKKQYDSRHGVRSDPIFNKKINRTFFEDTKKLKERHKELSQQKITWKSPKPEEIAKDMEDPGKLALASRCFGLSLVCNDTCKYEPVLLPFAACQ